MELSYARIVGGNRIEAGQTNLYVANRSGCDPLPRNVLSNVIGQAVFTEQADEAHVIRFCQNSLAVDCGVQDITGHAYKCRSGH